MFFVCHGWHWPERSCARTDSMTGQKTELCCSVIELTWAPVPLPGGISWRFWHLVTSHSASPQGEKHPDCLWGFRIQGKRCLDQLGGLGLGDSTSPQWHGKDEILAAHSAELKCMCLHHPYHHHLNERRSEGHVMVSKRQGNECSDTLNAGGGHSRPPAV